MFDACCYDSLLIHAPGPFDWSSNNWSLEVSVNSGNVLLVGNRRISTETNSRGTRVEGDETKEASILEYEKLLGESAAEVLPLTASSAQRVNLLLLNY